MPDAPPAIFTPPATPTPSAAGAVHASPSASPAAAAVVHASPGIPSPSAPGAVHVVPVGGGSGVNISGPLTSDGSTPVVFPVLVEAGILNGKMHYTDTGASKMNIGVDAWNYWASYEAILMVGSRWQIYQKSPAAEWQGPIDQSETGPEMVASWEAEGTATGTPVVSNGASLAAPGAVHASPGIPTPSSPGAVHASPGIPNPSAAATVHASPGIPTPTAPPVITP